MPDLIGFLALSPCFSCLCWVHFSLAYLKLLSFLRFLSWSHCCPLYIVACPGWSLCVPVCDRFLGLRRINSVACWRPACGLSHLYLKLCMPRMKPFTSLLNLFLFLCCPRRSLHPSSGSFLTISWIYFLLLVSSIRALIPRLSLVRTLLTSCRSLKSQLI